MSLILSIISMLLSITTIIVVFIKIKSIYINLYNLSNGMDVLFSNQEKILELTKIKGFVQLVNEEDKHIRKEISQEREKPGNKKE